MAKFELASCRPALTACLSGKTDEILGKKWHRHVGGTLVDVAESGGDTTPNSKPYTSTSTSKCSAKYSLDIIKS